MPKWTDVAAFSESDLSPRREGIVRTGEAPHSLNLHGVAFEEPSPLVASFVFAGDETAEEV